MARKVFISFLGSSNYRECRYSKDDFLSDDVRYIQEATLDYLCQREQWSDKDVAYILLTEGAKIKNWEDNGHCDFNTHEPIIQPGLMKCLQKKDYPFPIQTVEQLPDGKNEGELFEQFRRIFEVLKPGDSLYFDVTHGFRSLPLLVLVLINYAKFLKNVEIKSITYGNYEVRETVCLSDGVTFQKAPIIDLLPLSAIQDWTFAAADYLRNGNAKRFNELVTRHRSDIFRGFRQGNKDDADRLKVLANSLERVTNDFHTCRGTKFLSSENIANLRKVLSEFGETVIQPLNPLVTKMRESFDSFSAPADQLNCQNGFEAAKWCIGHNLYQQAATILQENIVSFFCVRYGLDYLDEVERKKVNTAFVCRKEINSNKRNKKAINEMLEEIENDPILKRLYLDEFIATEKAYSAFGLLTDERNDINHSGMRKEPHEANVIRKNIKKAFDAFYQLFQNV